MRDNSVRHDCDIDCPAHRPMSSPDVDMEDVEIVRKPKARRAPVTKRRKAPRGTAGALPAPKVVEAERASLPPRKALGREVHR
jgi:hypothetical protein